MRDTRKIAEYFFELTEKGNSFEAVFSSVKKVLIKYKRGDLLMSILKQVQRLALEKKDFETVYITTPFAIDEDTQNHILKKIGAHGGDKKIHIDKTLLAGFSAKKGGVVYDGSAKAHITRLKNIHL